MIPSEAQAESIGQQRTGGVRDRDFTVFRYVHNHSRLTCFGVEIKATREIIHHM